MKLSVVKKRCASALLGFVLALSGVTGASAQELGLIASSKNFSSSNIDKVYPVSNDEEKEELHFKDITIDIEEVATVTFINKWGEVVAILKGDKSVLEDIYEDKISNGYFLTSFGIHDVYLVR